jgi:lipopolysaccharide transport system permease protein
MSPHATPSLSPWSFLALMWNSRQLLSQLTRREIHGRSKGSILGLLWLVITPMLLLAVYTFVFSKVLKTQWSASTESTAVFASILFVGLCIFNVLADVLNRSARLIIDHANYVKRVVFPLELLVVVSCLATLYQFAINMLVLLASLLLFSDGPSIIVFYLPLVVLPVVLLALGGGWLISSLGVYLRDVAPLVALAITALLFLSPVFYPVEAMPQSLQAWYAFNPLALAIAQARGVLLWGTAPSWISLAWQILGSSFLAWLGFCWFQITKKGFADVL